MIIKNKRNVHVEFGTIKQGEVFTCYDDEDFYMRTETTYCNDNGDYDNAVNLANGNMTYFNDNVMVKIIKCELIIE